MHTKALPNMIDNNGIDQTSHITRSSYVLPPFHNSALLHILSNASEETDHHARPYKSSKHFDTFSVHRLTATELPQKQALSASSDQDTEHSLGTSETRDPREVWYGELASAEAYIKAAENEEQDQEGQRSWWATFARIQDWSNKEEAEFELWEQQTDIRNWTEDQARYKRHKSRGWTCPYWRMDGGKAVVVDVEEKKAKKKERR